MECGQPMDELRHVCAVLEPPAERPDLRALLDAAVAHEARAAEARVLFRSGVEAEYLAGRTLRDIAAEVGLTFQRIHALTARCRARTRGTSSRPYRRRRSREWSPEAGAGPATSPG